jgi:hypothetical protein
VFGWSPNEVTLLQCLPACQQHLHLSWRPQQGRIGLVCHRRPGRDNFLAGVQGTSICTNRSPTPPSLICNLCTFRTIFLSTYPLIPLKVSRAWRVHFSRSYMLLERKRQSEPQEFPHRQTANHRSSDLINAITMALALPNMQLSIRCTLSGFNNDKPASPDICSANPALFC